LSARRLYGIIAPMKALGVKEEQFLIDGAGKRLGVLVDLVTYQHLKEAAEELADIRAYDSALPKIKADLKAGRYSSLSDYQSNRKNKGK